jgi:hypothetical protein
MNNVPQIASNSIQPKIYLSDKSQQISLINHIQKRKKTPNENHFLMINLISFTHNSLESRVRSDWGKFIHSMEL